MNKFRIVSLAMAVAMLFSMSVFAEDTFTEDTPMLVATENIVIDGINYIERTYVYNGTTTQTLSIDESLSSALNSQTVEMSLENYISLEETVTPAANYPDHESSFSNSAASSSNSNCCVGHNGEFYSGTASLFHNFIGITGGQARGLYNGGTNAVSIDLSEVIRFTGTSINVSISSGGLSVNTSETSAVANLDYGTYTDCVLARCYRSDYECEGNVMDCEVTTNAIIHVTNSTAYSVDVSTLYSDVYFDTY